MQEVRRFTWCDVCAADAPDDAPTYEPAQTYKVVIDDDRAQTIDLCERHHKILLVPLGELLAAHGFRADMTPPPRNAPPSRGAIHPCLWCDHESRSVSGMGTHLAARHGFPVTSHNRASMADIMGGQCPYCAEPTPTVPSFGMHIYRQHRDLPATMMGAYVRARDMGDPHGIVAAVLAKAPDGQYTKPRRKR